MPGVYSEHQYYVINKNRAVGLPAWLVVRVLRDGIWEEVSAGKDAFPPKTNKLSRWRGPGQNASPCREGPRSQEGLLQRNVKTRQVGEARGSDTKSLSS